MVKARTLHYQIALGFSAFVTISAITGLLWAYAPFLYWKDGYKEKEESVQPLDLDSISLTAQDLRRVVGETSPGASILSVTMKQEVGKSFFDVRIDKSPNKLLIDPTNGVVLSPLSKEHVQKFARQYVPQDAKLRSVEEIIDWVDRKGIKYSSVWSVKFEDEDLTEIVIDPNNGEIIEDSDKVRRFHFWVMKLHQFNFFGTHKVLSALSGIPLLILIFTGAILSFKRLVFKSARRRSTS
jgi:uncharacterized iron-regulated membrane protein